MLKTALKPRWIALLITALVVSTVFVLLSRWQFDRSADTAAGPDPALETVRPLVEVASPQTPLPGTSADQMVSVSGTYLDRGVVVAGRLHDGAEGFWAVRALAVPAADLPPGLPAGEVVVPVARGWFPTAAEAQEAPAPLGETTVTGRLVPTEAPRIGSLPAGQVSSVSVAELVNLWDVYSYGGFVAATEETGLPADIRLVRIDTEPLAVQETNWLNVFYGVEWVLFAGFSLFLWWRLVADDHRRTLEDRHLLPTSTTSDPETKDPS